MNYLFRAFLSLKKHKTKSILLIIAVGLIATLLFCGISINDTAAVVQNNAMQNVGTQVKVEYDRAKIKNNSYQFISADTLKQLDSLAHIKDSTHVSYYLAMYKNIKLSQFSGSMGINVVSVTDSSKLNEFSTNSYEIVGGRAITKADEGKHVAVISDGIAKLNKLHVNDSITLLGLSSSSLHCLTWYGLPIIFTGYPKTEERHGVHGQEN